jgi:general secretion pathway protein F
LRFDAALLRLPVIGQLRLAGASSRLCSTLAALTRGGVPVTTALLLSARTAGNAMIATNVLAARDDVLSGARVSDALSAHRCISAMARRLARAGEESGTLAEMFERSAELDAEWVRRRIAHIVRFIEPGLILAFAGIVALVATALLQAVYSVRP